MIDVETAEYYLIRQGQEREKASTATEPCVKAVHFEMARLYGERLAAGDVPEAEPPYAVSVNEMFEQTGFMIGAQPGRSANVLRPAHFWR